MFLIAQNLKKGENLGVLRGFAVHLEPWLVVAKIIIFFLYFLFILDCGVNLDAVIKGVMGSGGDLSNLSFLFLKL